MAELIQYTGGSIVLTMSALVLALFGLIISCISLFTSIKRNKAILKAQKIEYGVSIISMIIIAAVASGTTGYYFCMFQMLNN